MIKDVGKACHALWVVAGGVESEVFGSWFYNAIMPADFTPIGAMNNEVRYVLFRSVTLTPAYHGNPNTTHGMCTHSFSEIRGEPIGPLYA